ncbi:MAG: hypothetical protein K2W96_06955 [Gemmataceae bacterium]|nr:hypothetical protein [Gemmataceae bacterium]
MPEMTAYLLRPAAPEGLRVERGSVRVFPGAMEYDPLKHAPGACRDFLGLDGSDEAVGGFVERFGLLLARRDDALPASEHIESVWEPRRRWLAYLYGLHRMATDGLPLGDFVRIQDGVAFMREPDLGGATIQGLTHPPAGCWVRPLRPVNDDDLRSAVQFWVGDWLASVLQVRFALHPWQGGSGWSIKLPTLWDMILWQAGRDLAGQDKFRSCASCGRWLLWNPKMDADPMRTACSDACRQRLHRARLRSAA